jgi:hypothetical protein
MGAVLIFLRAIPASVWAGLAAAIALMAALWWVDGNGYERGAAAVQVKWDAERVETAKIIAAEKARQAQVVERVVVQYVDRVKVIRERGEEVIREVEKLVPVGSCDLPGGFRVLHDAAAGAQPLPADTAAAAAAADAVEATAAARIVAENYAACHENSTRLIALQAWAREAAGVAP